MTKTTFPLFHIFVLVALHSLYASTSIQQSSQKIYELVDHKILVNEKRTALIDGYCRAYEVPLSLCKLIRKLLYGNPLQYKNKPLPEDLAGQDLCGYDFTGCKFNGINLTNTNLQGATLTDTTCDYLKVFEDHKNQLGKDYASPGFWYTFDIAQYLKNISEFYQNMTCDEKKVKLLHIASGFSQLPFYDDMEVKIKAQYWCCELKQLNDQEALKFNNGKSPILPFDQQIAQDIEIDCWRTDYPQMKIDLHEEELHPHFDQYLKDFKEGIVKYKNDREIDPDPLFRNYQDNARNYYVRHIIISIATLGKAYPKIKSKEFQQKACEIAAALSKSYQFEKFGLYHHYLFCQNRLVWLKEVTKVECIYYNYGSGIVESW